MLKRLSYEEIASVFSPVTPEVVQQIRKDPLSLHSVFAVNEKRDWEVHVVMTGRFIALCEKAFPDYDYLFYAPLEFDLKFEVIEEPPNPEKGGQNSLLSKPLGFRLFKTDSPPAEFRIVNSSVIHIWLKYMAKFLNQLGFHSAFRPIKKLGKGGFATVYQVERLVDGKLFAVKAFSKQTTLHSKDQNHRLNLLNEIAIMRSIDNHHLIKLEGVFESDNSVYVVLELLPDGHLRNRINQRAGKFSLPEVRTLMLGLARALKELHENRILHRDIKPENIMLRNGDEAVIVDFGLAARAEWDDYLFYRCGTPGYVAPEVTTLEKGKKISPVCDVFSVGAIFHILLTSKALFEGSRFEEVYQNNKRMRFNLKSSEYSHIDPVAMDLLEKMLKVRPSERITAVEVLSHPFLELMEAEKDKPSPITHVSSTRKLEFRKAY